jgi:hypothetical protein
MHFRIHNPDGHASETTATTRTVRRGRSISRARGKIAGWLFGTFAKRAWG